MQTQIVAAAPLSESERLDLQRLKGRVVGWRSCFRECGAALNELFAKQLWREFRTWENFCEEELQISVPQAYELRTAATVCDELQAHGFEVLPANYTYAFELRSLEPEQRIACWQKVLGRGKKRPTIAGIRLAKAEILGVPEGVQDDGTLSEDLRLLMKSLSPGVQAKVVRLAETRARQALRTKEKKATAEHPWLRDLRKIRVLILRLEQHGQKEVTAEIVEALHGIRGRLESVMTTTYRKKRET